MTQTYTRAQQLPEILKQRIVILDGAMGTMIQRYKLTEADYRGTRFTEHHVDVKPDQVFQLLQHGNFLQFQGIPMGMKIMGHFETDGLQQITFRSDVIVQTRRFYSDVIGDFPHGTGYKSFGTKQLRCPLGNGIFFTAVPAGFDLRHAVAKLTLIRFLAEREIPTIKNNFCCNVLIFRDFT